MNKEELKEKVIEELKKVYDPEFPVNLYDMGGLFFIKLILEKEAIKKTIL